MTERSAIEAGSSEGRDARCGAKLRGGGLCSRPPAAGKRRCRRHGGIPGFGARAGNRNALKHGAFTGQALAERRRIAAFIRECRQTMEGMESG